MVREEIGLFARITVKVIEMRAIEMDNNQLLAVAGAEDRVNKRESINIRDIMIDDSGLGFAEDDCRVGLVGKKVDVATIAGLHGDEIRCITGFFKGGND